MRPVITRAPSLDTSSPPKNPSEQPPSFDKQYWKAVALDVKAQVRVQSAKLEALQKVNNIIYGSTSGEGWIGMNEPSWAVTHADVHLERFENEFASKAFNRMVELRRTDNPYGGALGNKIFQLVTTNVVMPMLTTFFAEFASRAKNLEYGPKHEAMKAFFMPYLSWRGVKEA